MSQKRPHILILAGGTGGHIFPGLAIAKELQTRQWQVSWLGSVGGMEETLVKDKDISIFFISVKGLRGNGIMGWIKAPFNLIISVMQAKKIIQMCQPDLVLGFGGFASGPGAIAAYLLKKKLVIHEQNAVAGLTNRIMSRLASVVIEAFPNTFSKSSRVKTMGNPLRKEIQELAELAINPASKPINLLILGGSRGAQSINREIPKLLASLIASNEVKVKHQCGKNKREETQAIYQTLTNAEQNVSLYEFITDMNQVYQWADLVICRAGALTVSEIAAVGLAAIFIPYPYAVDDHQTANAKWLQSAGAAMLVQERELQNNQVREAMIALINSPENLDKMAKQGRQLAYQNATQQIADRCEAGIKEVA